MGLILAVCGDSGYLEGRRVSESIGWGIEVEVGEPGPFSRLKVVEDRMGDLRAANFWRVVRATHCPAANRRLIAGRIRQTAPLKSYRPL